MGVSEALNFLIQHFTLAREWHKINNECIPHTRFTTHGVHRVYTQLSCVAKVRLCIFAHILFPYHHVPLVPWRQLVANSRSMSLILRAKRLSFIDSNPEYLSFTYALEASGTIWRCWIGSALHLSSVLEHNNRNKYHEGCCGVEKDDIVVYCPLQRRRIVDNTC